MGGAPARALLLFLDGVGLGPADPGTNPLSQARMPHLSALLGGRSLVREEVGAGRGAGGAAWLVAADANLGVEGRPQSGTGQTSLLTGINAASRLGRHFGPWVPSELREPLARSNLLQRAVQSGRVAAFANAYPAAFIERIGRGEQRRPAAPPLAAFAAGVLTRDSEALRAGRAVASSIDNEAWRKHVDREVPRVSAQQAGLTLARIAGDAELTLFAHYDTDLVGHRRDMAGAIRVLERVDEFLGGLLSGLPSELLLVIASDHGNVEDVTTGHTRNPVPVVALGPGAEALARSVASIADVAPAMLRLLNID